ncbi:hypothetical protein HK105_201930 [Polyrhizophydium stewartii]|uniref:RING-type domain-containing protein n=1 Tax=Polyrhizophydium stewartii TaxID=2732419 RepID=A0ABR4NGD3_9FUNG
MATVSIRAGSFPAKPSTPTLNHHPQQSPGAMGHSHSTLERPQQAAAAQHDARDPRPQSPPPAAATAGRPQRPHDADEAPGNSGPSTRLGRGGRLSRMLRRQLNSDHPLVPFSLLRTLGLRAAPAGQPPAEDPLRPPSAASLPSIDDEAPADRADSAEAAGGIRPGGPGGPAAPASTLAVPPLSGDAVPRVLAPAASVRQRRSLRPLLASQRSAGSMRSVSNTTSLEAIVFRPSSPAPPRPASPVAAPASNAALFAHIAPADQEPAPSEPAGEHMDDDAITTSNMSVASAAASSLASADEDAGPAQDRPEPAVEGSDDGEGDRHDASAAAGTPAVVGQASADPRVNAEITQLFFNIMQSIPPAVRPPLQADPTGAQRRRSMLIIASQADQTSGRAASPTAAAAPSSGTASSAAAPTSTAASAATASSASLGSSSGGQPAQPGTLAAESGPRRRDWVVYVVGSEGADRPRPPPPPLRPDLGASQRSSMFPSGPGLFGLPARPSSMPPSLDGMATTGSPSASGSGPGLARTRSPLSTESAAMDGAPGSSRSSRLSRMLRSSTESMQRMFSPLDSLRRESSHSSLVRPRDETDNDSESMHDRDADMDASTNDDGSSSISGRRVRPRRSTATSMSVSSFFDGFSDVAEGASDGPADAGASSQASRAESTGGFAQDGPSLPSGARPGMATRDPLGTGLSMALLMSLAARSAMERGTQGAGRNSAASASSTATAGRPRTPDVASDHASLASQSSSDDGSDRAPGAPQPLRPRLAAMPDILADLFGPPPAPRRAEQPSQPANSTATQPTGSGETEEAAGSLGAALAALMIQSMLRRAMLGADNRGPTRTATPFPTAASAASRPQPEPQPQSQPQSQPQPQPQQQPQTQPRPQTSGAPEDRQGLDYDMFVRLAEMLGPARPQNAARNDVEQQIPLITFKQSDLEQLGDAAAAVDEAEPTEGDGNAASGESSATPDGTKPARLRDLLGGTHEKCSICLTQYDDGDELRVMSCRHGFHKDCLDQWLVSYHNSCPICRTRGVENTTTPAAPPRPAPHPAPTPGPGVAGVRILFVPQQDGRMPTALIFFVD